MPQIDLITGFLGAGKTTFIKKYARFLIDQGLTVGILENDYGAINIDMVLLEDLMGDNCDVEMIVGGDGASLLIDAGDKNTVKIFSWLKLHPHIIV